MFKGSLVALVTPFRGGAVDEDSLRKLVARQREGGTNVLVPCGTTGEAATLSPAEWETVVRLVVAEAKKANIPVVAGTGTNATAKTIQFTKRAKELGVDGALVVAPYYNKPPQDALVAHYEAVLAEVDLPLIVYNIPGRTGVNLLPQTVARLARHDNIVAIKEASGSIPQAMEVVEQCGDRITLLAGDDILSLPLYAVGAEGVVSVAANLFPGAVRQVFELMRQGEVGSARRLHYRLLPLYRGLFVETNPVPIKAALAMEEVIGTAEVRLPLLPLSAKHEPALRETLRMSREALP